MKTFPRASRPLEYISFFIMTAPTKQGLGYAFFACDAYSEFAFHTGVEPNDNPETILKHIYLLTEDSKFLSKAGKGFTLVLKDFKELSDRIEAIIKPLNGKILFDKDFHDYISKPVIKSFAH